jgi:alkylhydroperoxidase/carboxymuconolactone decarboxylase family protein YurZ
MPKAKIKYLPAIGMLLEYYCNMAIKKTGMLLEYYCNMAVKNWHAARNLSRHAARVLLYWANWHAARNLSRHAARVVLQYG